MTAATDARRTWYRPMLPRDPREAHRASTPLELIFDLCFVVAVALVAARLHHAIAESHLKDGLLGYGTVFFAIWWAWVSFSWFASGYDTDDVLYRLTTLVQIAGALVLAAGVPRAFDGGDFAVVTIGYLIMRVAMVAQWLRVARSNPLHRATARRYAVGIALCQVGWLLRLLLPPGAGLASWAVLVLAELAVPIWAKRAGENPWHVGHIAERYGLFTLIVLGESILAATIGLQTALDAGGAVAPLLAAALSGLIIVFAMWWVYFAQEAPASLATERTALVWGYGHLLIFASAAAVGAGLQVAIDNLTDAAHLSSRAAGLALAIPIAVYLVSVWVLHAGLRGRNALDTAAAPVAAVLVLAATATPWPLPLIALVMVVRVAVLIADVPDRAGDLARAPAPTHAD